jgi:enolase
MTAITSIRAREILDSRGNPTVEVLNEAMDLIVAPGLDGRFVPPERERNQFRRVTHTSEALDGEQLMKTIWNVWNEFGLRGFFP